jgi:hypothetical protein
MPPVPKPAATRQRRNKATTSAVLSASRRPGRRPNLPKVRGRKWHALTREWWRDVWASPMAREYDHSDRHGLAMLAVLVDQLWSGEVATREIMPEIRLQGQRFGLSPLDRRRLQWEIDRGDEAEGRTRKRHTRQAAARQGDDPRALLRVVE